MKRCSSFSDTCAESDSIPGPSHEHSHIPTESEDVTSLRKLHASFAQAFKFGPSTGTVENTNSSSKVSDSSSFENEKNAIVNLQMLENAFHSLNGHTCDNASPKLSVLDHNATTEMQEL